MRTKLLLFLVGTLIFLPQAAARAASSDFELKISPIQCFLDLVSDGSNTNQRLSPELCQENVNIDPTSQAARRIPITEDDQQNIIPDNLDLNSFQTFTDGSGVRLVIELGKVVSFTIVDGELLEKHTVTLKEIGSNYVVLTIASDPFDATIYVGGKGSYDLTGDKINDIEITLVSISSGQAELIFRGLAQQASQPVGAFRHSNYWTSDTNRALYPYLVVIVSIVMSIGVYRIYAAKSVSKL